MDIIKIVKENLDEKYGKFNWLYKVCIYLLNKCIYFLNRCFFCYVKLIYYKLKNTETKSKCVLINSPWGSGKTYRFKHNLQPIFESKGYRCVYISLFGIKIVDELKIKLINNCLNHKYKIFSLFFIFLFIPLIFCTYGVDLEIVYNNKVIIEYFSPFYIFVLGGILWLIFKFMKLNFIKTILFGLSNKYLGTGIPMNKSEIGELFNPYCDIFIFDDLERLSDDCKIKEILGFIADLKYIYGFNILIIGDESHISKNYLEEYKLYKEKLIDYEENEILITEEIFNSIVEQIDNEKVKQFVINGLKPHIELENSSHLKTPTTKNLRLILRCIDDIKRLFNNELINKNLVWISNNENINKILDTTNNKKFVLNKDIENIINLTFEKYLFDSKTLEERKNIFENYEIENLSSNELNVLNNINKEYIEDKIYKNKLQILNSNVGINLKYKNLSKELFEKIKKNYFECSNQIKFLNTDFINYICAFNNICLQAKKSINNYEENFLKLTKNILSTYYTDIDKCRDLMELNSLKNHFYIINEQFPHIAKKIKDEVNRYIENNISSFVRTKIKFLDNQYKDENEFSEKISIILDIILSFYNYINKHPEILLEILKINYSSEEHKNITKIKLIFSLSSNFTKFTYSQEIKNVISKLSNYYSSQIEKSYYNHFVKQIDSYFNQTSQN